MQFVVSCVMVCLYKSPFLPKTLGLQTPKQTGQIILQYIVKANHLSFFGSFCWNFSSARGGGGFRFLTFLLCWGTMQHQLDTCEPNTGTSYIKKRSERRKHCALAVVRQSQKISPRCRPPSRGRGSAKI